MQITLSVSRSDTSPVNFADSFGFFYQEDLSSGKVTGNIRSKPAVSMTLSDFASSSVSIAFCMSRDGQVPAGFYISSAAKYKVDGAKITRAIVGFDYRSLPFYAFASNGGKLVSGSKTADFSGLAQVFPAVNTKSAYLPQIDLFFAENHGLKTAQIASGGEVITIRSPAISPNGLAIQSSALRYPFSQISFPQGGDAVTALLAHGETFSSKNFSDIPAPIPTDPGLIIKWQKSKWREANFELFSWDRFPSLLYFDTVSYAYQSAMFKRLAFFVEKTGWRGKLWSNEEISGIHGYNAHDYKAESLAEFFDLARRTNFPLNPEEVLLEKILLANGIIVQNPAGEITAGQGGVISISQESPEYLRRQFVAHEGWHGLYFIDPDFRNTVASIFYTMDQQTLSYLLRYFSVTPSLNYDLSDDYLVKNEFMAYLLQQPVSAVGKYFVNAASRQHSQEKAKTQADYIIQTNAEGFTSAATLLDEYVNDRWGLSAGRVWLLSN